MRTHVSAEGFAGETRVGAEGFADQIHVSAERTWAIK